MLGMVPSGAITKLSRTLITNIVVEYYVEYCFNSILPDSHRIAHGIDVDFRPNNSEVVPSSNVQIIIQTVVNITTTANFSGFRSNQQILLTKQAHAVEQH